MGILDYVFFVVGLFVFSGTSLTVHEMGHFLVAKLLKIPILRFRVWRGGHILRWRWKGIEYVLGWLPTGGGVVYFSNDILTKALSDPALQGLIDARPELTQDYASRVARRYWAWVIVCLAGPIIEFAFVILMMRWVVPHHSEFVFVRGIWFGAVCHVAFSLGNLLPFCINGKGMDGFHVIFHSVLGMGKLLTGRHLNYLKTKRVLTIILLPFAVGGLCLLTIYWTAFRRAVT